eukprot:1000270-Rhodomonas_salina.1
MSPSDRFYPTITLCTNLLSLLIYLSDEDEDEGALEGEEAEVKSKFEKEKERERERPARKKKGWEFMGGGEVVSPPTVLGPRYAVSGTDIAGARSSSVWGLRR